MDGGSTIIYQLSHYLFFGKYHTNILLNSLRKLNLFEKKNHIYMYEPKFKLIYFTYSL
jgi:hypothetical protein